MIGRSAMLVLLALWGGTARAEAVQVASLPAPVASGAARFVRQPAADMPVDFQISLPVRDEAGLDRLIGAIEDPFSASYRRYLTVGQYTARFGPTQDDYDAVLAFARHAGFAVTVVAANRRLVGLRGTVAQVDQALHVVLGLYRHPTENRLFVSPDREPTLDLATPVLAVTGLDTFVLPVSRLVRGAHAAHTTGSGPGGQFIGSDMRAAYYGGAALTGAGQSVGLFELGGYNLGDVKTYFASLRQPLDVPVAGVSVGGAPVVCVAQCDDAEQALDIEEAIAMAPGQTRVSVYVGTVPTLILNAMAAADSERQLSCSWGWGAHPAIEDPIFKEFIVQGQTFLVATGDDGYLLKLGVVWPADDGYVTAVGGTGLVTQGPGGALVDGIRLERQRRRAVAGRDTAAAVSGAVREHAERRVGDAAQRAGHSGGGRYEQLQLL